MPFYEILVFAEVSLKSYRNFVERLDSRSRKRMNASLERTAEAMRKYGENFMSEVMKKVQNNEGYEDFSSGIHSLVEKLKEVEEEYYALHEDEEEDVTSSSSRVFSKSKMVGLYDQRRRLKNDVMVPWHKSVGCSVIIGTAGIGKTALALDIFEDLDIFEWFDFLAWVTVGNELKLEEITEAILAQVDPNKAGGSKKEMGEELKELLKGKRYLIVLDDVSNDNVYEYLKSSIPNNYNGSCVLITTRVELVDFKQSASHYYIDVRLLNKEESWDLLRVKVFGGYSCPPHLQNSGKKIAEMCDGLPLAIVNVADLLSKAKGSVWIEVATGKNHQLFIDAYDQIPKVKATARSRL